MSQINIAAIRRRTDRNCQDLTAAMVDRDALLALYEDCQARIAELERVAEAAWALVTGDEWPWDDTYKPAADLIDALAETGG